MFMDKPKTAEITFTKENLQCKYSNASGCPIWHALDDAGLPVNWVGMDSWIESKDDSFDVVRHYFPHKLRRASALLAATSDMGFIGVGIRRLCLQGKSFTVDL